MCSLALPPDLSRDMVVDKLGTLLLTRSKHSAYQEIYPLLKSELNLAECPGGRNENERWLYMRANLAWQGLRVIDIGANTGYFSMAAIQAGAKQVIAIEGNAEHAQFIQLASHLIGWKSSLKVKNQYFDFGEVDDHCDVILCLNILHHIGDDFGDKRMGIEQAKKGMAFRLQNISKNAQYCWLQLGFNWKGNRNFPLFEDGLKTSLIDFVEQSCGNKWKMERCAIFNPDSQKYETASFELLKRFDDIGEFLNRPLFLLKN